MGSWAGGYGFTAADATLLHSTPKPANNGTARDLHFSVAGNLVELILGPRDSLKFSVENRYILCQDSV